MLGFGELFFDIVDLVFYFYYLALHSLGHALDLRLTGIEVLEDWSKLGTFLRNLLAHLSDLLTLLLHSLLVEAKVVAGVVLLENILQEIWILALREDYL